MSGLSHDWSANLSDPLRKDDSSTQPISDVRRHPPRPGWRAVPAATEPLGRTQVLNQRSTETISKVLDTV